MAAPRRTPTVPLGIAILIVGIGWALIQGGLGAAIIAMLDRSNPRPDVQVRPVAMNSARNGPLATVTISLLDGTGKAISAPLNRLNHEQAKLGFKIVSSEFTDAGKGGYFRVLASGSKIHAEQLEEGTTLSTHLGALTLTLESIFDRGPHEIVAIWTPDGGEEQRSKPLTVNIDTRGPTLDTATLVGEPSVGFTLVLRFDSADLDGTKAGRHQNYEVLMADEEGGFSGSSDLVTDDMQVIHHGDTVRLVLGRLRTGTHRVKVNGETVVNNPQRAGPLTDAAGNRAGGQGNDGSDQTRLFTSYPEPERGPRVEFPEYLPTAPQPVPQRRANPADHVETRVVRLFYFRDAHRVAQLLNRTAKSYNRAAVDQDRRRAEDARGRADDLTDERRQQEREAVHAAEQLRRLENQMANAQQNQQYLQQQHASLPNEINQLANEIGKFEDRIKQKEDELAELNQGAGGGGGNTAIRCLPPTGNGQPVAYTRPYPRQRQETRPAAFYQQNNEEKIRQLEQELQRMENERDRKIKEKDAKQARWEALNASDQSNPMNQMQEQIGELRNQIAIQEGIAWQADEAAKQVTAKEDRAREDQFRLEVAAAHEDPDTYAPAKTDSVDPVAQVSISVIGEGVLQLRGPRKGIDQIRTMIHRIDQPLGQVKVDIITVQLNGERGERMEKPVGLVDANLGLGRFMTAQSLMLLRRAIQMKAAEIAVTAQSQYPGRYQVDRDREYLYGFFGRDFIDELYEMESEFLDSENKLLSLHSMDTISLHRALFVLALARNDVREEILQNFTNMAYCELPKAEFDYRRSAEMRPHRTQKLFPPWNRTHLPWSDKDRIDECTLDACIRNAGQRYHFRNLLGFFSTPVCYGSGDVMNPAQREFIRLAQIYKTRLISELELKQRVMERALVEDERERSFQEEETVRTSLRQTVLESAKTLEGDRFKTSQTLAEAVTSLQEAVTRARQIAMTEAEVARQHDKEFKEYTVTLQQITRDAFGAGTDLARLGQLNAQVRSLANQVQSLAEREKDSFERLRRVAPRTEKVTALYDEWVDQMQTLSDGMNGSLKKVQEFTKRGEVEGAALYLTDAAGKVSESYELKARLTLVILELVLTQANSESQFNR